MRDKQELKKTVLNFLLAQIKYKKIELQKEIEDADIVPLIKKEIKQIAEAIWFLEKANKTEELEVERQKQALLEFYLPATMSAEQTETLIDWLITELGITDLAKQRWMVMKELMARHKSEIEPSLVNDIINKKLAPKSEETKVE